MPIFRQQAPHLPLGEREAQADEVGLRQALEQDRLRDIGGQHDQERRHQVRDHVAEHDARIGIARDPRRIDIGEILLGQSQHRDFGEVNLLLTRQHQKQVERTFKAFDIAGSGMAAQSVRLNTTASNLANADSVAGPDGQPYKARQINFHAQYLPS